jgi:hypothetical protein
LPHPTFIMCGLLIFATYDVTSEVCSASDEGDDWYLCEALGRHFKDSRPQGRAAREYEQVRRPKASIHSSALARRKILVERASFPNK